MIMMKDLYNWLDVNMPESISQIVFLLRDRNKWMFAVVMVGIGLLLMPFLLEKASEETEFLAFLSMSGVVGVGVNPLISGRDGKTVAHGGENTLHYVCAALSGICSQLLVALNRPWWLSLWALYVVYTILERKADKNMFVAEVICILTTLFFCFL